MIEDHRLRLHEEILLLVLRDEEGTVASGPMYEYAIGGAILAELLLAERLTIERVGKRKSKSVVQLKSSTPMSDDVVDECLNKVRAAKKPKSAQHWVVKFAQTKHLKNRVARRLCDLDILRADEQTVLRIFSRDVYPEVDHSAESEIVARLEEAIFSDTTAIDVRTILLASLANGADLLRLVFDKKRLKAREQRIKDIAEGEVVGQATAEAIQNVQAALAVVSLGTVSTTMTATR